MLKKFLKGKARAAADKQTPERYALYRPLFEFLISCITPSANAEQLIQLGSKAARKSADEAFYTYLLFEKYLTTFELSAQHTRKSVRERVRQRFPALLEDDSIFNILFVSETEQKNTLAIQFLESFLETVRDKFGRTGDGYFE